jgi:hypothetical protein
MGVDGYAIRGLRLPLWPMSPARLHEIAAITGHRTLGDGAARSAKDKLERAQIANSRTERDNSCGKPIDN